MSIRNVTILLLILISGYVGAQEGVVLNVSTSIKKINFYDYTITTRLDKTYIPLHYISSENKFSDESIFVTNVTNIQEDELGIYYQYDIQSLTSQCERRGEVIIDDFMGLRINDIPLEDYQLGDKDIALEQSNSNGYLQSTDILTLYTKGNIPNDDIYYCSGQLSYMVSLSL